MEKILFDLKRVREGSISLDEVIQNLEQELREKEYKNNPTDKKQLSAIKRVLKNADIPVLKAYTPVEGVEGNRVGITDSYELYILNKDRLPFDVAFTNEYTLKDEYLKKYKDVNIINGVYPNISHLIPDKEPVDYNRVSVSDIIRLCKTTPSKKYKFDNKIILNLDYVKNCIDILKLKDEIIFEYHGEFRPVIIHNKDNEIGLILPIREF